VNVVDAHQLSQLVDFIQPRAQIRHLGVPSGRLIQSFSSSTLRLVYGNSKKPVSICANFNASFFLSSRRVRITLSTNESGSANEAHRASGFAGVLERFRSVVNCQRGAVYVERREHRSSHVRLIADKRAEAGVYIDVKKGGTLIEYTDEDPAFGSTTTLR
jgi:hypothetical protein